jgi:hypothetical protein
LRDMLGRWVCLCTGRVCVWKLFSRFRGNFTQGFVERLSDRVAVLNVSCVSCPTDGADHQTASTIIRRVRRIAKGDC